MTQPWRNSNPERNPNAAGGNDMSTNVFQEVEQAEMIRELAYHEGIGAEPLTVMQVHSSPEEDDVLQGYCVRDAEGRVLSVTFQAQYAGAPEHVYPAGTPDQRTGQDIPSALCPVDQPVPEKQDFSLYLAIHQDGKILGAGSSRAAARQNAESLYAIPSDYQDNETETWPSTERLYQAWQDRKPGQEFEADSWQDVDGTADVPGDPDEPDLHEIYGGADWGVEMLLSSGFRLGADGNQDGRTTVVALCDPDGTKKAVIMTDADLRAAARFFSELADPDC